MCVETLNYDPIAFLDHLADYSLLAFVSTHHHLNAITSANW